VHFLEESENGFVILDHIDSLTPKNNAKSKKGLFCCDKTGWRHTIFISEWYFFSTALEFDYSWIQIIYKQAHNLFAVVQMNLLFAFTVVKIGPGLQKWYTNEVILTCYCCYLYFWRKVYKYSEWNYTWILFSTIECCVTQDGEKMWRDK